ncbi:MAG: sigma-54-dependent Fis family transcriptional regulator [Deltaproteobacteria bacterium]|nr:sigma-54-dependent Fis family transcriptional regulator [Deltaproteobacteria bacterium]
MPPRVLVVDDEAANRAALDRILQREGMEVVHAENGREALEQLRAAAPDLLLTDLKMPGISGIELMRGARAIDPAIETIVMTAFGTVETAVEAMKEGAWDFVTKPLRRAELVAACKKALERRALRAENRALKAELGQVRADELLGRSAPMRALLDEARQVADATASVLLCGESGTGKGKLARLLHELSPRRAKPMITVNCGALPENLLESELFGHEAGAFTGAVSRREGRFELAAGGTLFLDEVTEMSPTLQVKLLRVLQDGEYERVGGSRTLRADARILAATNRDPEQAVAQGSLRADLFYRLNVIRLDLPPLRARADDVPLLAMHLLRLHAARNGRAVDSIAPEALDALCRYRWPGNVRELENVLQRAVVLCRGGSIELSHLPAPLREAAPADTLSFAVGTPLKVVERRMIEATLKQVDGDKTVAAQLLGITTRTLYRREAEWRGERAEDEGED